MYEVCRLASGLPTPSLLTLISPRREVYPGLPDALPSRLVQVGQHGPVFAHHFIHEHDPGLRGRFGRRPQGDQVGSGPPA